MACIGYLRGNPAFRCPVQHVAQAAWRQANPIGGAFVLSLRAPWLAIATGDARSERGWGEASRVSNHLGGSRESVCSTPGLVHLRQLRRSKGDFRSAMQWFVSFRRCGRSSGPQSCSWKTLVCRNRRSARGPSCDRNPVRSGSSRSFRASMTPCGRSLRLANEGQCEVRPPARETLCLVGGRHPGIVEIAAVDARQ